jgi:hypothetical protein
MESVADIAGSRCWSGESSISRSSSGAWTRVAEPEISEVHHRHGVFAQNEQALADAAHRTVWRLPPIGFAAKAQHVRHRFIRRIDRRQIHFAVRP